MRVKSFLEHLYDSVVRVRGWLIGALALVLSIAVFFMTPETKVVVGWLVVVGAPSALVIVILLDAAYTGWRASRRGLPEVRRVLESPSTYSGIAIHIVDPSDLFGVDALVSVYAREDEYERLIGIGRVLTIQTNGYIQIGV